MPSIAAQGGEFSFAIQSAKVGRNGTFNPTSLTWYRHPAPRIALGTLQEQLPFPPEVGGVIVTRGMYKQAYFGLVNVDLIPRLQASFGYLLKGLMGSASTVTDQDADGNSVTGVNTHIFRYNPSDSAMQPWMAFRRFTPGESSAENYGETVFDAKINSLRLMVPAKGKVSAQLSAIGRDVQDIKDPTWTYANTNEATEGTPDSGRGGFFIEGINYPITGATIDISNMLSTPDQEAIIGDFRMDDMIALMRGAQIRMVYKYENADLYLKLKNGSASATSWSSLPFSNVSSTTSYAFDFRFSAPLNIGTTTTPYQIRIRGGKVTWAVDGPPELAGASIIQQAFTGTVVEPPSGDFLQIVLVNGHSGY